MKNQLELSTRNEPICSKNHNIGSYYFCEACCRNNKFQICFFCRECRPQVRNKHGTHAQGMYSLDSQKFKVKFNKLKENVDFLFRQQFVQVCLNAKNTQIDKQTALQLFQEYFQSNSSISYRTINPAYTISRLFNSYQYRQWLITTQFWEENKLTERVKEIIRYQIENSKDLQNIFQDKPKPFKEQDFKINFGEVNQDYIDPVAEMEKAGKQCDVYSRELEIVNFLMEVYSSFSVKECEQVYNKCEELIGKKQYRDQQILYFAKIRLCELIPDRNSQIEDILKHLKQIDSKFKSQPIYYYFKAMQYWTTSVPQANNNTKFFYQPKNKQIYYLSNPEEYLKNLDKAIELEKHEVYYAARGIGYIILGKYQEASTDFQSAKDLNFDNIANNLNYALSKQCSLRQATVLEGISERTRQYVVNAARYFKKQKSFANAVKCCRLLLQRESDNETIQKQLIKLLVRGADVKTQNLEEAELLLKRLCKSKAEEKNKLERRIKMAKGKILWMENQYGSNQEALNIFEELAETANSATAFYNYAVTLYEYEKYQQALDQVNKAIDHKDSKKFRKLRLYLYCHLDDFQKAKEDLLEVDDGSDIYTPLRDELGTA